MIQIAHIIRQLLEKSVKSVKELGLKIKKISQLIKEWLTSKFIAEILVNKKVQLRFD